MTVVKNKRTDSRLEVVTLSRKVASYTIKICSNESNFPKRYRWCITSKIVESAIKQGIKFLGFKFFITRTGKVVKHLKKENISHERRKLKRMSRLVAAGKLEKEHVDDCYASWKAHAKKGNTFKLLQNMDKFYKNLWKD